MEEYTRDSLRQMRRAEFEVPAPKKGSRWITFLIILLFIFAGVFYLATQEDFSLKDAKDTLTGWRDDIAAVFNTEEAENDIEKTVNAVLAPQDALL